MTFRLTVACMKRLAFRSDFLSSYNYFWYELKRLINHCLPNVLYTLLAVRCSFFCHFFFQFATSFRSAVRWGRQALWLVLVVRWISERPANVLDYEALAKLCRQNIPTLLNQFCRNYNCLVGLLSTFLYRL